MKKYLVIALSLLVFVSCNNANKDMQKMVMDKFEQEAKTKGQEYKPVDFSEFYAIHFDESTDSLAKSKGLTPSGNDDVYWKCMNKGAYISINVNENPFCDLSDIKATAIETDRFIKDNGLTPSCYFVIHKYKMIDKDLDKTTENVAGLVVAPPREKFAGVLHCTVRTLSNQ